MAKRRTQGRYTPRNPKKYVGGEEPVYRSGWELKFFEFCDNNPSIIMWGSENLRIPYKHPITEKTVNYLPDIFMVYIDKKGKKHAEVVEIKPAKETLEEKAKNKYDRLALLVNQAKWRAAMEWCFKKGFKFRVITENEMFKR